MGSRRINRLTPLITPLLLISLLATSFSCTRSSNDGLGGDWNPDSLGAIEISRLPIPAREHGYSNFESKIIAGQAVLDDFISDVQQQDGWNGRAEFLQNVNEWQVDFSTHNVILYRHTEPSGSIEVSISEPHIDGNTVIIDVNRFIPMVCTDDMAYYCYAYKVGKPVTSVTFVVDLEDDVSFRLSGGDIVIEEEMNIEIIDAYCTDTDSFHFTLKNLTDEHMRVDYSWALNGPMANKPRGGQGWGDVRIEAMGDEEIVLVPDDMLADDYDARFYVMYIHVYYMGEQVAYYIGQKSTYDWDYTMLPPVPIEDT